MISDDFVELVNSINKICKDRCDKIVLKLDDLLCAVREAPLDNKSHSATFVELAELTYNTPMKISRTVDKIVEIYARGYTDYDPFIASCLYFRDRLVCLHR